MSEIYLEFPPLMPISSEETGGIAALQITIITTTTLINR